MKKYVFSVFFVFMACSAFALTEVTTCNDVPGYEDATEAFRGGYKLVDGNCPTGYIKVTTAKSMLNSPTTFYGWLYTPANTDIVGADGHTYRTSEFCLIDYGAAGFDDSVGDWNKNWVQGNGSAYLKLVDISIYDTTGVQVDFTRVSTSAATLFGLKQSTSNSMSMFTLGFDTSSIKMEWNIGFSVGYAPAVPGTRYVISMNMYNNRMALINGSNVYTLNSTLASPDNREAIPYIFAMNSRPNGTNISTDKIHGIKITSGGSVTHDFKPMKRDGQCGLYDTVTHTFFGSNGLLCGN